MNKSKCESCISRGKTIEELCNVIRKKNRELDALHYVWCNGGCNGGVHRYTDIELTEDIIKQAEANTSRLRQYWSNLKFKEKYNAMSSEDRKVFLDKHFKDWNWKKNRDEYEKKQKIIKLVEEIITIGKGKP